MIITLITLLAAAIGFVWGKIRSDIVALIALLILTVSGVLTTQEALSGFSNSIVIMMVGLFVVGGAVFNTGLAKMIGAKLLKLAGNNEGKLFLVVMAATALIGGFVSNTGTVALILPIVVSMAAGAGISTGRLLMPLAFASSLGGMMTLIGTPPNLIIAEVWENAGHEPLTFFSFLPAGAICLVAGTILLIPLSKWFLSKRGVFNDKENQPRSLEQIVDEYGLESNLYRVTIPGKSPIVGKTLGGLALRKDYNIEVMEIRQGEEKGFLKNVTQTVPTATSKFEGGDTLYVRGNISDIDRFAKTFGLHLHAGLDNKSQLQFYNIGIAEIIPLPSSAVIGHKIADIGFGARGVSVIGIRRKNSYITSSLGNEVVHSGDVLLVQGSWKSIGRLGEEREAWVVVGEPLEEAAKVTLDYKAPVAGVIMLAMVVALVLDLVPSVIAVMIAAVAMLLTGCFRNVDAAYKTIKWESIVLIAAMMPMSFALEKNGISEAVANALVDGLGGIGPHLLLAGIYFTTSLMTLFISNTATAVLMAPIAAECAATYGVSALPFLFAVTFGASLCFASPFSTPPNALVMPIGQYRFTDYIKVGLPLQVLLGILMIFVLPLIFPF